MARKPAFISHSREREAQIQRRMLDVLERTFRRRFATLISQQRADLVRRYEIVGEVPGLSETNAMQTAQVYQDLARASARTFGRRIITRGKSDGLVETKEEPGFWEQFFNDLSAAWAQNELIRQRIVSVTETTRAQIVAEVAKGLDEGLSIDSIAKAITERTPAISRWRGALIARTETHGAANFAMQKTAKETGLDLVKEWVSTEDHRTRRITGKDPDQFDHVSMDGQTRAMDDAFDMPRLGGGAIKIMYPGEAGLPGGATINCRCAIVHSLADDVD